MSGNKIPTTTVHQARLQIFQPTRRPKDCIREIETSWGSAVVDGKLGQTHADMLEAIFYNAISSKKLENGDVNIIVDPYRVRISVGGGKKYSYSTLIKHSKEVMKVLIELRTESTGSFVISHIIQKIIKSTVTANNPALNAGGSKNRELWQVTISNEFMELVRNDLPLHYNPLTISSLEKGVSQAVVRLILTHKEQPNGGWNLDRLLIAVGVDGENSQEMRNRRRDIKKDTSNLSRLGIFIENSRVKHESV
jgi:hypothetical protein